jgi:hypothetical protein
LVHDIWLRFRPEESDISIPLHLVVGIPRVPWRLLKEHHKPEELKGNDNGRFKN